MNKLSSQISIIIIFTAIFYAAYYILLQDNFMHISINSIISRSHGLNIKKHLIVLGLLPIYIATIVFGAAILSFYLGSTFQEKDNSYSKDK